MQPIRELGVTSIGLRTTNQVDFFESPANDWDLESGRLLGSAIIYYCKVIAPNRRPNVYL